MSAGTSTCSASVTSLKETVGPTETKSVSDSGGGVKSEFLTSIDTDVSSVISFSSFFITLFTDEGRLTERVDREAESNEPDLD